MRIELCGGIASGKTTFARSIEVYDRRFKAVYEDFSSNTFLSDFYKDSRRYAYETELSFLLQHMHQIKLTQLDCPMTVCDFSIEQDYAYAQNNLDSAGLASFHGVYKDVIRQVRAANLIIFLECPTQVLLERIRTRGRSSEMSIDIDYLGNTVHTLKDHLSQIGGNYIVLDSNQYDFRQPHIAGRVLLKIINDLGYWTEKCNESGQN